MTEQILARVNDALSRWRQMENQMNMTRVTYFRNLESCYEVLKEAQQRQQELLVAILNQKEEPQTEQNRNVTHEPLVATPPPKKLNTIEETEETDESDSDATKKRQDNVL